MNNQVQPFDGIIADTISGGIGFRNHSIPVSGIRYGAEWEEDILWMQPESACVDTNISASYTGILDSHATYHGDLVDRGGFCNLQRISPYDTSENTTREYIFANGQANPHLYERAYFLAWKNNAVSMEYLNITDPNTNRSRILSHFGQKFQVNGTVTTVNPDSQAFFQLSRGSSMIYLPSKNSWNSTNNAYDKDQNPEIPNPHNITADILSKYQDYIKGTRIDNRVNISTLDIELGSFAGPAVRINQSAPNNASSAVTWERPYYVCAAATKVLIKTVRFRYNATKERNLNTLEIVHLKDKVYASEAKKPVWGFETPCMNETTTWNLSMINPLWGLVSPTTAEGRNITLLRSENFYIPASLQTNYGFDWGLTASRHNGYTPATSGPSATWTAIFNYGIRDPYTGNDLNQQVFIREMMRNTTSTSRLLNLMWTDMAANTMVGTRGIHQTKYQPMETRSQKRDKGSKYINLLTGQYPVYILDRHIRYKWVYGIPAFICIGVVGIAVMLALISMICGHGTVERLRWFMFNVSLGRVFASYLYPESMEEKSAQTKQWLQSVGLKPIRVCGHSSSADGQCYYCRDEKSGSRYVRVQQRDESDSFSSY
ncbi:hypothetical protein H2198_009830 [Neophaeococcomyces mojaviensis]|uniref:Uncharacterized protein n=1 Tax=Neophaeococcomyces mojaviensis TaxID=3383035 RepID=A0ACC2ZTC5_9EURO|nr:hypothetical protein H2198_009830 [Knufia sp. JES_112]